MDLPDKQVDSSEGGSFPRWMHVNLSDCVHTVDNYLQFLQ